MRAPLALLWLCAAATGAVGQAEIETETATADTDSVVVERRPHTRYGIIRTHVPDSPGGPQVAVSLARYVANFGSREGVKPGSIFDVYKGRTFVGLVRVERVYRDSASLRLITLERKIDPDSPEPVSRGYLLFPRYVLLESINFGTGKPDFSRDMHERLRYAARFILSYPDFPVVLEGHTDNTGKKSTNVKLAVERAGTIEQYLHEIQLIPRTQIFTVGYADERPIATNNTEAGRFRNRRVDVVMVHELPPEAIPGGTPPAD